MMSTWLNNAQSVTQLVWNKVFRKIENFGIEGVRKSSFLIASSTLMFVEKIRSQKFEQMK